jgi:hypothetical protein
MRVEGGLGAIPWEDYSPEIYFERDMLVAGYFHQTYGFKLTK